MGPSIYAETFHGKKKKLKEILQKKRNKKFVDQFWLQYLKNIAIHVTGNDAEYELHYLKKPRKIRLIR